MSQSKHSKSKHGKSGQKAVRSQATVKSIDPPPSNPRVRGIQSFGAAAVSLTLLWLSFPPVAYSWLAWIAPAPLIWIILTKSLRGNRPYLQLYIAGFLYWAATFYFIPIPHPVLWIGWFAVSAYMAIYTPFSIAVARTLVHRFSLPSLIVVPIVWTGIECIRSYFATGMAMVCLSHTQYQTPVLIQVADIFGAYTLTFMMIVFATASTIALRAGTIMVSSSHELSKRTAMLHEAGGIGVALSAIAIVVGYGNFRLGEAIEYKSDSTLAVGLIQSSNDVVFRPLSDDEHMMQLVHKFKQTWNARSQWNDLDLVVWPESGFNPYVDLISNNSEEETVEVVANVLTQVWSDAVGYPDNFPTPPPLLTGGGTLDPENDRNYGSAFLIANDGKIETRYFKNHLVMFGEYVPLANVFPVIKQLSPIGAGISAGSKFETVTRNGVHLAPSICFETTVPHFIRRQVNTLAEAGNEPDALINLTNDGWFYGTSCLDLHLACNVFRAVEMRKPHLVCANTGFSAEIDSCGRLIQVGPRREPLVIRADIRPIRRTSFYRRYGDIVPLAFGVIVILAAVAGYFKR